MARLLDLYNKNIKKELKNSFNYKNDMQIPKLLKIVVNVGIGEAALDKKKMESPIKELASITGQKPVVCKSKKAIAAFKLREDIPIGCKVTLRGKKMYEFLDRFINIAMPRIRDFRGLSGNKGFDGCGNYSIGIKEQIIFPEIDYNKIDKVRGLNINICTTSKTNEEVKALLKAFNMPFNS